MLVIYPTEFNLLNDGCDSVGRWAALMWDTLGFDYDKSSVTSDSVCIWPLDSGAEALVRLKIELDDREIEYSIHEENR